MQVVRSAPDRQLVMWNMMTAGEIIIRILFAANLSNDRSFACPSNCIFIRWRRSATRR
jgi:hypothetical protein